MMPADLLKKPWWDFHTFNSSNLLLPFQIGEVILTYSVPSVRDRCLVLLFLTLWTCLGPRPVRCLAHQWHSRHCTRRHLLLPQPLACHLSSIHQHLGWLLPSQQLLPSHQLPFRLPGRLPLQLLAQCPVLVKPRAPLQSRQQPRWPHSLRPQSSPHPWPPLSHRSSSLHLCMPSLLAHRWASQSTIFVLRLFDKNFPIKNSIMKLLQHLDATPKSNYTLIKP